MAQRSGINRALMWLRKTLEITEETEAPQILSETLRPTIDVFGWDRLPGVTVESRLLSNSNAVQSSTVPADVLRLVLEASVETNDTVQAFTYWVEHIDGDFAITTGLMRPIAIPISAVSIRAGIERIVVLRPGDRIQGRCSPATGVGLNIRINTRWVELPIGEYVGNL